jgi:Ca-activated chloride channel family protein
MKRLVLFTFLLLMGIVPAAAQELICPTMPPCPEGQVCPMMPECLPIQPGVFTNPEWLRIEYHRVQVTVVNQIATTSIDMQFLNEGNGLAEGTFVFPLPQGAAVDQLTMYINGQAIDAKILPADQARGIYNEIVRRYRDPALLEYIGSSAIQANVFPIPPGERRRIEIRYQQVLEVENGLLHYVYPLKVTNLVSPRPVDSLSVRVEVSSADPISSIYSPSHPVALSRSDDDRQFTAGFESAGTIPTDDFSLFYGIASQTINANLLTYRESATEDGFFMLLVQPPIRLPDNQIAAKDVIIVLDQSGSMEGLKWDQAREAAIYVLNHLNPSDRFNVVLFSTGWRNYSNNLEAPAQAQGAIDWLRSQSAVGGTDINGALTTALSLAGSERPTTVLFLTDGLATEGITATPDILANLKAAARPNVRIFTFGVGDDVDTVLLDSIARDMRGTGSYVRPSERIDEEVAALYSKISAPVLTDVTLEMNGVVTGDMYPTQPLPDLFAGTQLTLVGRYRGEAANITITLRGTVNGQEQVFRYDGLDFPGRAGGEPFIARLWATRRIGDLLNSIRVNGENPELVESIVKLSVRYGIITPYTSFLITEDDILTAQGRDRAEGQVSLQAEELAAAPSGSIAVDAADTSSNMAAAEAPMALPTMTAAPMATSAPGMTTGGMPAEPYTSQNPIQTVGEKTFLLQNGVWTDTIFQPDVMQTVKVAFLSDAYFALLDQYPELGPYFALGDHVIVVIEGIAYEVMPA